MHFVLRPILNVHRDPGPGIWHVRPQKIHTIASSISIGPEKTAQPWTNKNPGINPGFCNFQKKDRDLGRNPGLFFEN